MSNESHLSILLERWQQSHDGGRPLPPEELCRDCPELLDELERTISVLQRVERLAIPAKSSDEIEPPPARAPTPAGETLTPLPETPGGLPVVPGYQIVEVLGKGGAGVVYRARQTDLNREVALKMILAGSHAGAEERQRFLVEAKSVAALKHPGIVQVHDFGTHEGQPFFAMELCTGGSLAQKLNGKPLPPEESARLVEQVARAVQAAHSNGIVHRDIKPGNILLDQDGQPRVTDFGLAKQMDVAGLTLTGVVLGTPAYMAPEQARGSKEIAPTADVYSLGAILYECLTGRPPFLAANHHDVLLQVVTDEPVSVRQLNVQAPRDLETICHKCLQKEPGKRYSAASDLAEDLARWRRGEPILARPIGPLGKASKWVRRRPLIAALAAATVLALVGGTGVSLLFAFKAKKGEDSALQQKEEAREALAAAEEGMAIGLLRPLGHYTDIKPLNDFELDALEELAALPKERLRVRELFIAWALQQEGTAGQLGRRLEESLIAAIGLRRDLRIEVLHLAGKRLRAKRAPASIRVVSACLLAELQEDNPRSVADACEVLVDSVGVGEDNALPISKSFIALVGKHHQDRASALAGKIIEVAAGTTDPITSSALSDAFAVLAGKLTANESSALAKDVLQRATRNSNPETLPTLSKTFSALAGKVSPDKALDLSQTIGRLAGQSKDPDVLRALSMAFSELAGKLPSGDSRKYSRILARRIGQGIAEKPNPDALHALSGALSALADKLDRDQSATSARRILQALTRKSKGPALGPEPSKSTDPGVSSSPLKTFALLTRKLEPAQAIDLIQPIAGAASETTDPADLSTLADLFVALADKLPAKEVGKLAEPLLRRITRVTDETRPSEFIIRSKALVVLSDKLAPDEVAPHAAKLVRQITTAADKTKDPDVLLILSKAFADLAGKLSIQEASDLARTLSKISGKTNDPDVLPTLATAFEALADKIPAASALGTASDLARPIVELAGQTADSDTLRTLSIALARLAGKLPTAESDKHSAKLARRLVELMAQPNRVDTLGSLSRGFSSLAGKVSAAEAVALERLIVQSASKTSNPEILAALTSAFQALADRLEANKVESCSAILARRVVEFMGKHGNQETLFALSATFESLVGKISPTEATSLGRTLGRIAGKTRNPVVLSTLAKAFESLAGKLSPEESGKGALIFEQQIIQGAARMSNPAALVETFAALANQLPTENKTRVGVLLVSRLAPGAHKDRDGKPMQRLLNASGSGLPGSLLVSLLKHPGCVEPIRSLLLQRLSKDFNRPFGNVWELADYLAEHEPRLDLDEPLRETRQTPRARSRASLRGVGEMVGLGPNSISD